MPEPEQDPRRREPDLGDMLDLAERLYEQHQYRKVVAICKRLAEMGHAGGLVAVMREGCENALRRRTALWCSLALSLVGLLVLGAILYAPITRFRVTPPPGPIELKEGEARLFAVTRPFGRHRGFTYTWSLSAADGAALPGQQGAALTPVPEEPWRVQYAAPPSTVLAAGGAGPARQQLAVRVTDGSDKEVLTAQWPLTVHDVPAAPTIASVRPSADGPVSLAPGMTASFALEATDGDGGKALHYTWLLADREVQKGDGPSWVYKFDPEADQALADEFKSRGTVIREVACHVANAHGSPLPQTQTWTLRLVAANRPPAIQAIEPAIEAFHRLAEGERLELVAHAIDADPGDVLSYHWAIDGVPHSQGATCELLFPHDSTATEKEVVLTLTVTDLCGAKTELVWPLTIINAQN